MTEAIANNIPNTTIAPSPIHGMGLFCDKFLPKGSILGLLDGQVVPFEWVEENAVAEEWSALAGNRVLVRPFPTKYRYINHSRQPNAKVLNLSEGRLQIRSLRDLAKGEEILLDYREEPLPERYKQGHGASYL